MAVELGRNLFWGLLTELLVVLLALLLRDDRRRMIMALAAGTLVAGMIGFGPQLVAAIDENIPGLPTVSPDTPQAEATQRPLVSDYQSVSLRSWSELSEPETNLGLGPGLNSLLDIPFETGWKASTQCSHLPNQPESFHLETNIDNPVRVYLLIQAGWGLSQYEGIEIGTVHLAFSDGNAFDTPLTLGLNIRDWAWENDNAVNTASSPSLQPAWEGHAPDGTPGGMDILTIDVPDESARSRLERIDIDDLSQPTLGQTNPCIHLVALTVEYLH